MRRRLVIGTAALLAGLAARRGGSASAQQPSDAEAIRAANAAFYAALSARDIHAMERVWAHDPQVSAFQPNSKTPLVGWDAVRKSWEEAFGRYAELSVTMADAHLRADPDDALVVGVETARGRLSNGEPADFSTLAANAFIKREGRWLMVHHHASRVPQ